MKRLTKEYVQRTGDIIGLIHSDDFLFSSHTISDIVKTFEEQDADMIYGNGVFVDYDDTNQMIRNWISGRYSKENVKTDGSHSTPLSI